MCGIAGELNYKINQPVQLELIRKMCQQMNHRGPDDEGYYIDGNVGLGMKRLSIIDLTGGHQPIHNETETVWIIFNGEIYNYRELRPILEKKGHRFATNSDTEVIIHCYEEYGTDCVNHLNGMFAFAIWDSQKQALFLARDRLGIKPLYYYRDANHFLFASEARALLASGLVPHELSMTGLVSYLSFGHVFDPFTIVKGINALLPGHFLWITEKGVQSKEYWDLPRNLAEGGSAKHISEGEALEQVRELLQSSVKLRLVSEVPVGAFLSGGIDSSAIVALMSQVAGSKVKTFSIVFDEQEFSEAKYSRLVSQKFGTEHYELIVREKQMLDEMPYAIAAMDEPTINGINTYFVSQATKQAGITVALSGLGGDEVFCGYGTFRTVPQMQKFVKNWNKLPGVFTRLAGAAFNLCAPTNEKNRKISSLLCSENSFHPYFLSRQLFSKQDRQTILNPEIIRDAESELQAHLGTFIQHARSLDPINQVSVYELCSYMGNMLLRDTDFMSMAHSLEVRVPLLDYRLVEFVLNLPGISKLDKRIPKPLLVNALGDVLPDEIIYRPKQGFTFPFAKWLKHQLRDDVEATLFEKGLEQLNDCINPQALHKLWNEFLVGRRSWSRPWSIYVLKKWANSFLR